MCFHRDGFVQGYRLITNDQLPALDARQRFVPTAVMQSAASILRFLAEQCANDGSTYYMCRAEARAWPSSKPP